jgi:thiamine-phosphate pyrophosphorylase
MLPPERLSLMVLTDPRCGPDRTVLDVVHRALHGGAPSVQLRAKHGTSRDMLQLARELRRLTREAGALLFVNDRVDIALASDADGAHLGDDDLPLGEARRITPVGFLIGRSVDTPEEAAAAERDGADYVGLGPIYGTPSKLDAAEPIGIEGIAAVRASTRLPIVAIGGMDEVSGRAATAAGADGIAVIRAVMEADDPAEAAKRLVSAISNGIRERGG